MAYENIQVAYPNFTGEDGYFYNFDHNQDNLVVKTDDGNVAFTYPLDTALSNEVESLEFDGFNFWTLENAGSQIIFRRWQIQNYICVLQNTFIKNDDASHNYDSNAFTVEHYHFQFSAPETIGQTTLSVDDPEAIVADISTKVSSGNTVRLGPSTASGHEGEWEEFSVVSAGAGTINVSPGITHNYEAGDPIHVYKYIWAFNNYNGVASEGALYKFDAYTGSFITKFGGNEYDNITACTFAVIEEGLTSKVNSLAYVRGSNMLFKDVESATLENYGSMAMDNIESDDITIIPVYDLVIDGKNVYRLQRKATYYGSTTTFADSAYSYQLATVTPFIHSISLQAAPAVIPADAGVSTSAITAVVKSQFLLPISGKLVTFSEDNANGYLTGTNPDLTDADGIATITYHSGTDATEVTITATAQQ
jgi:hypothetical protein